MRRIILLALVASLLVALLPGGASAETQSPAPNQQSACRHTVVAGETLSGIASQYGTDAGSLAWANGIRDVNFIVAGDSISVPCKKLPYVPLVRKTAPGTSAQPVSAPSTSTTGSCGTYKVKAGDSLSALSVSLDFSVEALASANGITTQAGLYTGKIIQLPCD